MEGDVTTIFDLRVAKGDLGKVIGKQGKTAYPMRTIINATASKLNQKATLDIIE